MKLPGEIEQTWWIHEENLHNFRKKTGEIHQKGEINWENVLDFTEQNSIGCEQGIHYQVLQFPLIPCIRNRFQQHHPTSPPEKYPSIRSISSSPIWHVSRSCWTWWIFFWNKAHQKRDLLRRSDLYPLKNGKIWIWILHFLQALANYVRAPVRPDDAEPNMAQPATWPGCKPFCKFARNGWFYLLWVV